MSEEDKDLETLKDACLKLGEHFESVHIFVTKSYDPDDPQERGTINASWGSGNWFARYGQIRTWLIKQDEEARKETRGIE